MIVGLLLLAVVVAVVVLAVRRMSAAGAGHGAQAQGSHRQLQQTDQQGYRQGQVDVGAGARQR